MKLSPQDAAQYFELSYRVLSYTNQKLNLLPDRYAPDDIKEMTTEERAKVRNALWENAQLIDSFVDENPFTLSAEELEIVSNVISVAGWAPFIYLPEVSVIGKLYRYHSHVKAVRGMGRLIASAVGELES